MPPLCNYNNNDDDDFATEYVIQDAYTQTTVFSLLLFLHWCQLLLSGWLKNREPFFYWGSPNSWKNDDTQLPNSFRVFLVSGWMSLLGKRIAQDGSERAPNRCLPRRASHTENWAAWGDTRDFPLPVSMWLCGTGDKTFKTRTTPEGRAVSCATRFLQCVSSAFKKSFRPFLCKPHRRAPQVLTLQCQFPPVSHSGGFSGGDPRSE